MSEPRVEVSGGGSRFPPPWIWFFLNLPFGATSGFGSVALAYLASRAGMGDEVVAAIVAMNLLPQTLKFFWAPVCDTTFNRKQWYLASNLFSSLTLAAIGFVPFTPETLWLVQALVFINSVSIACLGMSVEGLMANATPPEQLGRASGWYQAGNLGGAGIGGGLTLLVAQRFNPSAASLFMGALLFACNLSLRFVPETPRGVREGGGWLSGFLASQKEVARDLWSVFASKSGVFALTLCFVPLGAGAASGLFSAIADRWGASADLVALSTGTAGGVAAAAGCLGGGWLSDRMNRKLAYAATGLVLASAAVLLAVCPHTPFFYGLLTLNYSFGAGLSYGAFTGFALEVIGKGAVATKYNALASLSNLPTWYMTLLLGWVSARKGPTWMLLADAGAGAAGAVVLVGLLAVFGKQASGVGAAQT